MGTWGTGMFQSDKAGDFVDIFEAGIVGFRKPAQISQNILTEYKAWFAEGGLKPEELDFYILVLAAIELEYDALQPDIREQALEILARGGDLQYWEDCAHPETVEERRLVLEKLETQLRNFTPSQRKEKLFTYLDGNLHVGDVFAFDYLPDKIVAGIILHTPPKQEHTILVGFYEQTFDSFEAINLAELGDNFILSPVYTLDYVNIVFHKMTPWRFINHEPNLLKKLDITQLIEATPLDLFADKLMVELNIYLAFQYKEGKIRPYEQVEW